MNMTFAENIKQMRQRLFYSQEAFAKVEILTEKRQRLNEVNKLIESGMKNRNIAKNKAEKEVVKDIGGR